MSVKIKKVLVVDDSMVSRSYFINILKAIPNLEFIQADDGNIALQKIESDKPDCMILDNLMSNKTGIEVLEELKDKGIKIPTILLTADIQKTTRAKCMELGAFAFLNKPVEKEELISAVNKALNNT